MYNIHCRYYSRQYFITKIEYFARRGYNFSHISEMNVIFITDHRIITYEFYLRQPKSMLEWKLIEKLARNPNLKKLFNGSYSHPLVREYYFQQNVSNYLIIK